MRTSIVLSLFAAVAFVAPRADGQIAVLSALVEERTAAPGESYTGRIVISNAGREAQAVRIFQTDYRFLADGSSAYEDPATLKRSNAQWVTPQSQRLTIPAGGEVALPYSVKVPAGDSLKGTYWSTIQVEGQAPPPTSTGGAQPQLALGAIVRYAVQVATHIGTAGARTVKFENPSATRDEKGEASLDLDVLNTGQRGYRPTVWIEVYDSEGALKATARQARGLLYPETSLRQHFVLGTLPAGSYKALVFADTGDETIFAAQFAIKY
jgi:hypothetical protein